MSVHLPWSYFDWWRPWSTYVPQIASKWHLSSFVVFFMIKPMLPPIIACRYFQLQSVVSWGQGCLPIELLLIGRQSRILLKVNLISALLIGIQLRALLFFSIFEHRLAPVGFNWSGNLLRHLLTDLSLNWACHLFNKVGFRASQFTAFNLKFIDVAHHIFA